MTTIAPPFSIRDLFTHLYAGVPGQNYLAVASGERRPGSDRLHGFTQEFFAWPAQADQAESWLLQEDFAGRDVYLTAHLVTERKRTKVTAARVRTLWADIDGGNVPSTFPPTALIASSDDRKQGYWRLSTDIDPVRAERLNQRLAAAIGADPSGYDLTQLLRPPGTHNHKYEHTPLVRADYIRDGFSYDPDELERLLPELPDEAGSDEPIATVPFSGAIPTGGDVPPVPLDDYGLAVWRGEIVQRHPDGGVERSNSLYHIGGVLHDAGVAPWLLPYLLQERDQSLGWNKYQGRPQEYSRIAAKLARKGRGAYRPAETILDGLPGFGVADAGGFETDGIPDVDPPPDGQPSPRSRAIHEAERERDRAIERGNRYRKRAIALAGKLRRIRRETGEERRRLAYLERRQSAAERVLGQEALTPIARIFTLKLANLAEGLSDPGRADALAPGEPMRVPMSEPAPGEPGYEPGRAGYSMAAKCGASTSAVRRAKEQLQHLGVIDAFTDKARLGKRGFTRDSYTILPAAGGHPGLGLLEAVASLAPVEKQPKVRVVEKPPCPEHPTSDVEVVASCIEGGHELRRRILRPKPDAGMRQNDALGIDQTLMRQNDAYSPPPPVGEPPTETAVPDAYQRAFAGDRGTVTAWCALCRGLRTHRHDPLQPSGVGDCLACGGWGSATDAAGSA